MWPIAEIILYDRYVDFKLNYLTRGPRLLQRLCPSGYNADGNLQSLLHRNPSLAHLL